MAKAVGELIERVTTSGDMEQMGYISYFLIVGDLSGTAVSRGSPAWRVARGPGSLVAYLWRFPTSIRCGTG
ncbi:MAG: hypothetical protein CM1200mP34_4640 [Verrucomicrobiales bacterium]|nr:MAG: hypothetical protein CM1200mP34_4640 [Verrucomicrobiales bacterium]